MTSNTRDLSMGLIRKVWTGIFVLNMNKAHVGHNRMHPCWGLIHLVSLLCNFVINGIEIFSYTNSYSVFGAFTYLIINFFKPLSELELSWLEVMWVKCSITTENLKNIIISFYADKCCSWCDKEGRRFSSNICTWMGLWDETTTWLSNCSKSVMAGTDLSGLWIHIYLVMVMIDTSCLLT